MKKLLIVLLGIICVLPFTGKALSLSNNYTNLEQTVKLLGLTKNKKYDEKKDDVEIILFYGSGCPHCHDFIKFLNSFDKEYNHISLRAYEVWDDSANATLMQNVGKELDIEVRGVPFIIIGKKNWMGYGASMEQELRDAIKTEYETPLNERESYFTTSSVATTTGKKTTTTTIKPTTTTTVTKNLTTNDVITNKQYKSENNQTEEQEDEKEEKDESILSKYRYVFIAVWAIVLIVFGVIIFKSKKNN